MAAVRPASTSWVSTLTSATASPSRSSMASRICARSTAYSCALALNLSANGLCLLRAPEPAESRLWRAQSCQRSARARERACSTARSTASIRTADAASSRWLAQQQSAASRSFLPSARLRSFASPSAHLRRPECLMSVLQSLGVVSQHAHRRLGQLYGQCLAFDASRWAVVTSSQSVLRLVQIISQILERTHLLGDGFSLMFDLGREGDEGRTVFISLLRLRKG